jgi:enoyl-[acyl-carrier protein] reductase I
MGFLAGKRALIVGLATERSIAHGIAQAMHREGAELAFTYLERLKDRVVDLAGELGSKLTMPMNVESDDEISRAFADLKRHWDSADIIVHSVAFAPREALAGGFVDSTSRDSFRSRTRFRPQPDRSGARRALPDGGAKWRAAHLELSRRGAVHSRVQRHGAG